MGNMLDEAAIRRHYERGEWDDVIAHADSKSSAERRPGSAGLMSLMHGRSLIESGRHHQYAPRILDGLAIVEPELDMVNRGRQYPPALHGIIRDCKISRLYGLRFLERFAELDLAAKEDPAVMEIVRREHQSLARQILDAPRQARLVRQSKSIRDSGSVFLGHARTGTESDFYSRMALLNRALDQYDASAATCESRTSTSASLRNSGVIYQELAKLYRTAYSAEPARDTIKTYLAKAIIKFDNALNVGKAVNGLDWIGRVLSQVQGTFDELLELFEEVDFDIKDRFECFQSIAKECLGHARVLASHHAGDLLFHIQCLQECRSAQSEGTSAALEENITKVTTLERAAVLLRFVQDIDLKFQPSIESRIASARSRNEDILKSVTLHLTAAEAARFIIQGNLCLNRAFRDAENIEMELVFDALDMFLQATRIAADGLDLETEARACSRVAYVFNCIFKNTTKAHEFAKRSLELALACMPRSFECCSWFQTAKRIVREYQEKVARDEARAREDARKPYMKELKPVLDELNKKRQEPDQPRSFLLFVYEKHSPGDDKVQTPDELKDTSTPLKVVLRKALLHYHPDKIPAGTDVRVAIVREEITKHLTSLYEIHCKSC